MPNSDYNDHPRSILEVPRGGLNITPADSDLAKPIRSLHVGGAGTVHVTFLDGSEATYTKGADSSISAFITRVWATGTTATLLVGEY